MLDMHSPSVAERLFAARDEHRPGLNAALVKDAWNLYHRARHRGQLARFWAALTRRSNCLHELATFAAGRTPGGGHYAGTRAVPIDEIRGSEGRYADFDRRFNPLGDHSSQRWVGLAMAHLQGVVLPPVVLVQVGDIYFVQDGHHRISVARAMGQKYVEAVVTVWRVSSRVLAEQPVASGELAPAEG
ncbi:MAG TPA: hypothetical protein VER55_16270 [Ardenticatenaceae bacterium]|nr:hypothetical protein [Ardenticatenaceae bacterium]